VFKHLTFTEFSMSKRAQWMYTRIVLAQKFPGWTLDYIDSLSYAERAGIFAVLEAQDKVLSIKRERQSRRRR
jgi:hypothetical protein